MSKSICISYAWLTFVGLLASSSVAEQRFPTIWSADHTEQKDRRIVKDRLYAGNNQNHENDSFLDAVGAVWPDGTHPSAAAFSGASGFLFDSCHVLTNMHAVYADEVVVDPPAHAAVTFAVGQTPGDIDKGRLQGLKFVLNGVVVAHGATIIVGRRVKNPGSDWAVIRLAGNADSSIVPMKIGTIDPSLVPAHAALSAAGFPLDHRRRRRDGFKLKDLWGSEGQLVAPVSVDATGALIRTTLQTTPGDSGGPVYGDFDGQMHIVIGMVQSFRGNGIDVSESRTNDQILFTAAVLSEIREAQAGTPCR